MELDWSSVIFTVRHVNTSLIFNTTITIIITYTTFYFKVTQLGDPETILSPTAYTHTHVHISTHEHTHTWPGAAAAAAVVISPFTSR